MSRFILAMILAGTLFVVPSSAVTQDHEVGIAVWVHNYGAVPEPTLDGAKNVVSEVFESAGIGIEWVNSATSNGRRLGATDLVLRTVTSSMIADWGLDTGDLAFALVPRATRSGYIAGVITDRVDRVAARLRTPPGTLLGYVMAHELGHLLLGTKRHSARGIMSFPVDRKYVQQASKGLLQFRPSQVRRIRDEIVQRGKSTQTI